MNIPLDKLLAQLDGGHYEYEHTNYRDAMIEAARLIRELKPRAERWQYVLENAQSAYIRCKENEKIPILVFKPDFDFLHTWQRQIEDAVDRKRGAL